MAVRALPYPLRRLTLDERRLGAVFGGLIRFGRDGAYVEFDQKSTGDHILFTKKYSKTDEWNLEIAVTGFHATAPFLDDVKRDLAVFEDRFKIENDARGGCNRVMFSLTGAGLEDHDALESVARLLVRRLGHPKDAKYRIELDSERAATAELKQQGHSLEMQCRPDPRGGC